MLGEKWRIVFLFFTSILYSCVFAQPVMGCMYLTMQIDYRQNYSIKYQSNHNISVLEMICGTFQTQPNLHLFPMDRESSNHTFAQIWWQPDDLI